MTSSHAFPSARTAGPNSWQPSVSPETSHQDHTRRLRRGSRWGWARIGGLVGTTPGDRIRKAIQSAAPQLRALSGGIVPTMVVVYNNAVWSRLQDVLANVWNFRPRFIRLPVDS